MNVVLVKTKVMEINELRCLIADDEKSAREVLEKHINKIPYLTVIGICHNAAEALIKIKELRPDIVFLDIQMPGLNGLELISLLPAFRPKIVVVSGNPQFAINGFELQVTDYILKPVTFERLAKAVMKAIGETNIVSVKEDKESTSDVQLTTKKDVTEDDFLLVKDNKRLLRIDLDKIHFVEAMKDYLKIHWVNGVTVLHQTMGKIEEKLPSSAYLRVHRSFIVNRKIIAEIAGNEIVTTAGKTIPIGPTYRESILRQLGENIL